MSVDKCDNDLNINKKTLVQISCTLCIEKLLKCMRDVRACARDCSA